MGNHAHFELMLVIAWASAGIAMTAIGGVARIVGLVLLGLLVLLLVRGLIDTWKHERRRRADAQRSVDIPGAAQDNEPGRA